MKSEQSNQFDHTKMTTLRLTRTAKGKIYKYGLRCIFGKLDTAIHLYEHEREQINEKGRQF